MFQKLIPLKINIPDGFAVTADAYRLFIHHNQIGEAIQDHLKQLDLKDFSNLNSVSSSIKKLFLKGTFPDELTEEIEGAYRKLCKANGRESRRRSAK